MFNQYHSRDRRIQRRAAIITQAATACCLTFAAVIVAVFVGSATTWAQEAPKTYKVIPFAEAFREINTESLSGDERRAASRKNATNRKNRNAARDAARDGIAAGNMTPAKEYLNGFIFPEMTQPDALSEAGSLRDSFFRTFMKSDVSSDSRKKLISEVIMPAMAAIATGSEYSPSARLNAIMMVGRLDESALTRSGTRYIPPKPSSVAYSFLSNLLFDEATPPWLKAASIQGLMRHLKVDLAVDRRLLTDEQRQRLQSFAMATLDGKAPGQDQWEPDLDYWLKRRSVQLLGGIGRPGNGNAVIDRLVAISGDAKQKVWMQFDAIAAIRQIDFTGVAQEKISQVLLAVADFLTRQMANEESNIAQAVDDLIYKGILYSDVDFAVTGTRYEKDASSQSAGMMGMSPDDMMGMDGMGMGGMGMGGLAPTTEPAILIELPTYQLNLIRRRINVFAFTCLTAMRDAKGLLTAATEKDKSFVQAINQRVDRLLKDSSVGIRDLSEEVDPMNVQSESYTEQLRKIAKQASDDIKSLINQHTGQAPEAGDPSDPASAIPAADSDPLGIGG